MGERERESKRKSEGERGRERARERARESERTNKRESDRERERERERDHSGGRESCARGRRRGEKGTGCQTGTGCAPAPYRTWEVEMFRGLRERRGDGPAVTPEGEGRAPAAGRVSASRWSKESTQHRVSWAGHRQGGA